MYCREFLQLWSALYPRSIDERRHCKKYSIGFESFSTMLSIPPEFDTDDVFHSTIGQKVWNYFINIALFTWTKIRPVSLTRLYNRDLTLAGEGPITATR